MKIRTIAITLAALMALNVQPVLAKSKLVGHNSVSVPANSDVFLTLAFTKEAAGTFTILNETGSGFTVAATLPVNAYANLYYLRMTSGAGNGLWSTISSNTAGEFILADTSIMSHTANGDAFVVIPHQTLGTVFPDSLINVSYKATLSPANRLTEVFTPNTTAVGINKSAAATYFYFNNEWRKVGQPLTSVFNDVVLPPQEYFILRNRTASPLTFVTAGEEPELDLARVLLTQAVKNDVAAASGFPTRVTLAELNLGGTSAFTTTVNPAVRQDELFVFNNTTTGFNKSASATYYYFNGAWRKVGSPATTNFNNEKLDPASAILIRRAVGAATATWTEPSPY